MPLVRSIDIRPRQADLVTGSIFPSPSPNSNDSSQSDQSQTDTNAPRKSSKSHARKREEGHIPRPRNAFIIFRTDFVTNGGIPSTIEAHSQNLSRIAGNVWKSMSPEEKKPWFARAEEEKAKHLEKHPEYQYHPTDPYMLRNRRKVRKGRGEVEMRTASQWCDEVAKVLKEGVEGEELEKELKKRTATTTTTRPRGPMVVDDFPSIEPIVDVGYVSTETIPCIPSTFDDPVRQFDATSSVTALLNNEPLPSTLSMSMSSRESSPPTLSAASSTSSSPSTNSHTLSLPPISTTPPPLILPSKISISRSNARQLPPPPPPFPGALHVPDKPRSSYRAPPPAQQSTYTYQNVLPSKIRSYGAPPPHSSSFRNPNPIPPSPFSSSSSSSGGSGSSSHPLWPSSSSVAMQYRPSNYESNATTSRGDAWALRSPVRGPVSISMSMASRPAAFAKASSSNFAATSRSRRMMRERDARYDSDEDEDEDEYSSDREHDYDYESD